MRPCKCMITIPSFCLVLTVITACSSQPQQTYPRILLEDYCLADGDQTKSPIPLSCSKTALNRAGTIIFSSYGYPSSNCSASLVLDGTLCSSPGNYAIYFNVKSLNLRVGDSLEIYGSDGDLLKILYGGPEIFNTYPTSYGQLRSNFSRTPGFNFNFVRLSDSNSKYQANSLALDYIVVRGDVSDGAIESPCMALGGQILDVHFCETGDRVNCPSSYSPNSLVLATEIGGRPSANVPFYCRRILQISPTGSSGWIRPPFTTSDWGSISAPYEYNYSLPGAALAAIVIGGFIVVVLLILLVIRFCVASRARPVVYGYYQQTTTVPAYSAAMESTPCAQSATALAGPECTALPVSTVSSVFMDAPPPYWTVSPAVAETPRY